MNKNDKFHGISPEMNPTTELNDDELDSVAGGSGDGNSYAYSVGTNVRFWCGCKTSSRCWGGGGVILSRYTNGNTNFNAYMNMYKIRCEYCGSECDYTEGSIHT